MMLFYTIIGQLDATIVSNDNYRDLTKIIENRVIGYSWCNDNFILPKDLYGKRAPILEELFLVA